LFGDVEVDQLCGNSNQHHKEGVVSCLPESSMFDVATTRDNKVFWGTLRSNAYSLE
jgi:hypothetical protein